MSRVTIYLSLFFIMMVNCSSVAKDRAVRYKVKVLESLPHSVNAYTQGLFFHNGSLFESSGQYGESYFREINLKTGATIRSFNLAPKYFAEGAVVLNNLLYLLTWMENEVLVYDINSFKQLGTLYNPREGWGLTTDGKSLIMTDGSDHLFFMDPNTFMERSRVKVTLDGKKLDQLNELEFIDGKVWANVYGEEIIVIIDPKTGVVEGVVECFNLLSRQERSPRTDVLNGIAYNSMDGSIYITGKYWPKMFKIEIVKR